MFSKIIITFAILFQFSEGYPSETTLVSHSHDVSRYLSSRIVGGQDAPIGYAKHMVALVVGSTIKMLSCGGSIVSERVVLTAAHCIDPFVIHGELSPYLTGVIGSNYWNSTNKIKFVGFKNHPDYNPWTIKNDIGVLITAKIVYGELIQPIAIKYDFIGGGERAFVTGWGTVQLYGDIPYRLQLLYLKTISPAQCVFGVKLASAILGWDSPPVDPKVEICTYLAKGHGMCHGDSGSALVHINIKTINYLIGLVSWGFPCAIGAPDMYARVSAYKCFIEKAIEETRRPNYI